MSSVLLTVHVVAALLTLGPVAVAGSLFPKPARALVTDAADQGARAVATVLHRICHVYSIVSLAVPTFGVALAYELDSLGDVWLLVSIGLTAVAAAILAFGVLPEQREVLRGNGTAASPRRLALLVGLFNLVWVAVAVLMVVQPGARS
ncbi:hypothetical protein [Curtobacterium sp. 1544]|jgi:hypothetical protein|uniref:hypothetical protein n=1 Tax=Curtobacterium sp. 1544 TaxID=3156417 RepID=UPI003396790C